MSPRDDLLAGGTARFDHTRSCPSCERELGGREHFGEGGLTVIWKCLCGWGSARTVPTGSPAANARAATLGLSGSCSRAEPPASTSREPSAQDALDIRIRKSSGVRARPVEAGAPDEGDPARHKARESGG